MPWPFYPRPSGIPRKIPAWAWRALKVPGSVSRVKPAWFWVWRKWRLATKNIVPVYGTMYDSVTISEIPKTAKEVAGYVGGNWPTYKPLKVAFPHADVLSIAVSAKENADVLDVESGDAAPNQAAAWVRRQKKRGVETPVVYTSAAFVQGLVNELDASGLRLGKDFKVWSAHYTGKAHLCSPKCGFGIKFTADATQYTDKALGRNLDASRTREGFFPIT